jgi:3-hydroxyisobutyrate dehydrogenase-like beta-hydroxyacid dehydrogenase
MGLPMARRLVDEGHTIVAFDVDPGQLRIGATNGVEGADSLSELSQRVGEFVVVMVRDAEQMLDVVLGADGLLAGERAHTYVIMSTVGRAALHDLSSRVVPPSTLLDAPVSGGVAAAKAGTLVILTSGDNAALDRASGWLGSLSSTITPVRGGIGAAQAAKIACQLAQTLQLLATAESLRLARSYELVDDDTLDALTTALGPSWATDRWSDVCALEDGDPGEIALDLLHKDVRLAVSEDSAGADLPLGALALQLLASRLEVSKSAEGSTS